MSILLLADSSEGAYACTLLADELRQRNLDCLVVETSSIIDPNSPLQGQVVGGVEKFHCSLKQLLHSPLILRAKTIGAFIKANAVEAFVNDYRQICQLNEQRPAPVFSGPIFPLVGDSLIADLLPRMCCDLICVHGQRQLEEVHDLMHLWPKPVPTVALGFWFMPESPANGGLVGSSTPKPPHMLVVLAQKGLPKLPGAQTRMLRLLSEKARESPHWHVLIQGDHALPTKELPLNTNPKKVAGLPKNLSFGAAGNLPWVLGRCSACLTVSSPWIFTAMAWGRPVLVMGDHGIRTDHGSIPFFSSGVVGRLDALTTLDDLLELPHVNSNWLDEMGWDVHDGVTQLINALVVQKETHA